MAKAKIKKEFAKTRIGFGQSGKPLGERDDIDELAIMAHKSKDSSLLKLFETLPDLEELQTEGTKAKLATVRKTHVTTHVQAKKLVKPAAKKDETANADEAK